MLKNITTKVLTLLSLATALCGCINNDIPLPYIKGDVLKFEVEGQTDCKIDPTKNIIKLDLSDVITPSQVQINKLEITEDAKTSLAAGQIIDLTKDTTFVITTYQEYTWTISMTQTIDRHIQMSGQVGDAIIDTKNLNAVVKISSSQSLYDITVDAFQLGSSNAVTVPNPKDVRDFSMPKQFVVKYHDKTEIWTVVVIQTTEPVVTGDANPWGKFAYLAASIQPHNQNEAGFEYRKDGDEEWTYIKATVNGSNISARITDLQPNTSYQYRGKIGSDVGSEKTFQTEATPTIDNLNFDSWYKDGRKWYPNSSGGNSFWASGNEGLVLAGKDSNTTPVEGADAVKGKAVRMETVDKVMIAKIAAGNIFTGVYKSGMPTKFEDMKKLVVFGRPYTGRPTTLKGWYKYLPKPVNLAADPAFPFTDSMGKMDWAHIYFRLENWGDATTRPAEGAITKVAYGEMRVNKEVGAYTKFEIPIVYSDMKTKPTHVTLVATPSINGGDFCGGVGSTLFVDEFELGFD